MPDKQIASWEAELERCSLAFGQATDQQQIALASGHSGALDLLLTVVYSGARLEPQERVETLLAHARRYSRLRNDKSLYISAKHAKLRENAAVLEQLAKEIAQ